MRVSSGNTGASVLGAPADFTATAVVTPLLRHRGRKYAAGDFVNMNNINKMLAIRRHTTYGEADNLAFE